MKSILLKNISLKLHQQKGQALIMTMFFAAAMLGICAVAIDVGMVALDANQLQRGCDAAALAGAAKLKTTGNDTYDMAQATAAATEVAQLNGCTVAGIYFSNNNTRVKVAGTFTRKSFFGAAIGQSNLSVARHASAERTPVDQMGGNVPLGICSNDYDAYKSGATFTVDLMRNIDDAFGTGNSIAVNLDNTPSKPVSVFENEVEFGYTGVISISQLVNALNGDTSVQNALRDGMNYRQSQNSNTFTVLVFDPKPQTTGTSWLPVKKIAKVELQTVEYLGHGNDKFTRLTLKILANGVVNADEVTFVNNNSSGTGGTGTEGTGTGSTGSTTGSSSGYSETGISVLRLVDDT